jgi:hypothetical protein
MVNKISNAQFKSYRQENKAKHATKRKTHPHGVGWVEILPFPTYWPWSLQVGWEQSPLQFHGHVLQCHLYS